MELLMILLLKNYTYFILNENFPVNVLNYGYLKKYLATSMSREPSDTKILESTSGYVEQVPCRQKYSMLISELNPCLLSLLLLSRQLITCFRFYLTTFFRL